MGKKLENVVTTFRERSIQYESIGIIEITETISIYFSI